MAVSGPPLTTFMVNCEFVLATPGLWLAIVAWLAGLGAGWLRRPAAQRWLGRVTGVVFIGFGIRLAAQAR